MVVNVKCGWISWVWVNFYTKMRTQANERKADSNPKIVILCLFSIYLSFTLCVTNDQTPSTSLLYGSLLVWTWSVLYSSSARYSFNATLSHTKCWSLPCIFHYVLFTTVILMTLVLTLLLIMIVVVTGTKISACLYVWCVRARVCTFSIRTFTLFNTEYKCNSIECWCWEFLSILPAPRTLYSITFSFSPYFRSFSLDFYFAICFLFHFIVRSSFPFCLFYSFSWLVFTYYNTRIATATARTVQRHSSAVSE